MGLSRDLRPYLVVVVLLVLVLSVYWQVGDHTFINVDDQIYVSENPNVLRGLNSESVSWAFSTFHTGNWHPLTWLSHMVDVELFGRAAGWHHRTNVLFHLLNTELLFLVLWAMTGGLWQSALVAVLFAVHPLHVESVAWVAERKDVLSTLFWILTMGAYLQYVRHPSVGRYLVVAATFAVGLMCKPMLVTLPFVLLLFDFWPLERAAPPDTSIHSSWRPLASALRPLVWEKIPLFALSASSCAITYLAQAGGGAVAPLEDFPFVERTGNAFVSYVIYLGNTVWPSSLAVFYPHPWISHQGIPAWELFVSALLLGGVSFLALWQGRRRPHFAVGWLWYLGTLVPVIGLVQIGSQAMADRYTYVPLIGIFISLAWGIPPLVGGQRFRRLALGALAGTGVIALSVTAWNQTSYWRDSVTLLSRTLAVTEKNLFAWNNLGVAYSELGQFQHAIESYREALRIRPLYAEALHNLGIVYNELGQSQHAIDSYRMALRIRPGLAEGWNNLGVAYSELGQLQHAIDSYREALRIRPDYADAWNNLGLVYDRLGQLQHAVDCYRETLRVRPDHAEAWNNLGVAYYKLGRFQQAIDCFSEALRIKPDYSDARNSLDTANARLGRSK